MWERGDLKGVGKGQERVFMTNTHCYMNEVQKERMNGRINKQTNK